MRMPMPSSSRYPGRLARQILDDIADAPPEHLPKLARLLVDLGTVLRYAQQRKLQLQCERSQRSLTSAASAFYFDVFQRRQSLGYISRGWNDPGIRVGDLLFLPARYRDALKPRIKMVLDVCSGQGVSTHWVPNAKGVELHLWSPVYGHPPALEALHGALQSLQVCKRRVRRLAPFQA